MHWAEAMSPRCNCVSRTCRDDEIRRAAEILMPIAQAREASRSSSTTGPISPRTGSAMASISARRMGLTREARAMVGPNAIVGVTCHDFPPSGHRGRGGRRRLCRFRRVLPHHHKEPKATGRHRTAALVGGDDGGPPAWPSAASPSTMRASWSKRAPISRGIGRRLVASGRPCRRREGLQRAVLTRDCLGGPAPARTRAIFRHCSGCHGWPPRGRPWQRS